MVLEPGTNSEIRRRATHKLLFAKSLKRNLGPNGRILLNMIKSNARGFRSDSISSRQEKVRECELGNELWCSRNRGISYRLSDYQFSKKEYAPWSLLHKH